MHFLQAFMAPVEIKMLDRVVLVPKMTMSETITWSQEIMEARLDQVTSDMDANRRNEYLTFYPPVAPNFNELAREIRTAQGARDVVDRCRKRGVKAYKVNPNTDKREDAPAPTEEEWSQILDHGSPHAIVLLAIDLADLEDRSKPPPQKDDDEDPTKRRKPQGSTSSSSTGAANSQSSQPRTQVQTGGR